MRRLKPTHSYIISAPNGGNNLPFGTKTALFVPNGVYIPPIRHTITVITRQIIAKLTECFGQYIAPLCEALI